MIPANQEFLFTRQHHMADRMGEHWDYRLVHGDKAYSFATKKEMPEAGKSIMLFEQPVHDRSYALSKKVVIPKGQYGAGTTYLDWIRKAKIGENSTADQMTIYTRDGDKFLLKRMKSDSMYGDKSWLFKNLGKVEKVDNKYLEKIAQWHELEPGVHYNSADRTVATEKWKSDELVSKFNGNQRKLGFKLGAGTGAIIAASAALMNPKRTFVQNTKRTLKVIGGTAGVGAVGFTGLAHLGNKQVPRGNKIDRGLRPIIAKHDLRSYE